MAEFKVAGGALRVGVTPIELKEIVYQAVASVGMGKAFDFIRCHDRAAAVGRVSRTLTALSCLDEVAPTK